MKAFNRQLMAKSPWVMTAVYNVTCLRLCIIFSRLSVKRPRQQNYLSLLLLTINTHKMVTPEKKWDRKTATGGDSVFRTGVRDMGFKCGSLQRDLGGSTCMNNKM